MKTFTAMTRMLLGAGLMLIGSLSARSQVTLQLVDPADTSSSSLTVAPGATFSLDAYVQGLSSPALDSYNLTILSPLPSGFTLNSFTDTVPADWLTFPDLADQVYGAANFGGSDLTGNAILVQYNFTAGTTPGSFALDFGPQSGVSGFQNLLDSSDNLIPFSQSGAEVMVVPEPGTTSLLLAGLLGCLLLSPRWRRVLDVCRKAVGAKEKTTESLSPIICFKNLK